MSVVHAASGVLEVATAQIANAARQILHKCPKFETSRGDLGPLRACVHPAACPACHGRTRIVGFPDTDLTWISTFFAGTHMLVFVSARCARAATRGDGRRRRLLCQFAGACLRPGSCRLAVLTESAVVGR
jgi:hypothetical protein